MRIKVFYKSHAPKGYMGDPKRGAALGRVNTHDAPSSSNIKLVLRRVHLCSNGYDENGTYFGLGMPIYWYAGHDEGEREVDGTLRATSRDTAKGRIRAMYYPNARFYR